MFEEMIDISCFLDENASSYIEQTSVYHPLSSVNDTIWQHMRVEYFEALLRDSALFMKPVSSYSHDLEESPVHYMFPRSMAITHVAFEIDSVFEKLDSRSFLSCWYRSPYLVDSIYARFTKDKDGKPDSRGGIAIRSTATKLINCIQNASAADYHFKAYSGLVKYLPPNAINKYICPSFQKIISDTNKIDGAVPYFFKKTNLADESEFRILLRLFKYNELIDESKPLEDFKLIGYQHRIDISQTLDGFAIPYSYYPLNRNTRYLLESHGFSGIQDERMMDEYVYYRLERNG